MLVARKVPVGQRRQAWSWRRWVRYYRRNAETLLPIPWQSGAELTGEERRTVLRSLREIQQGEGLEAGRFFLCVRRHAEQTGDWEYVEAQRLFMAEEKRHAADLAQMLDLAGVRLFCWIGGWGGMGLTLAVVVMVEVCCQTYYGVLRKTTGSRVLQHLCARILHDEVFHVRFQCEALARRRRGRPGFLLALTHGVDSMLFLGAFLAFWWVHGQLLRRAGAGFAGFWQQARLHLRRASMLKDPRNYAWEQAEGKR
jgi:hypothetical protein